MTRKTIRQFRKGLSYKTYLEVKNQVNGNGKHIKSVVKLGSYVCFGLLVVFLSSYYVVNSALAIVEALQISSTIIGLTLLALGTSVPELAVCVAAARKRKGDLIVGTVIGSNIYNLLLVIGLTAVMSPLAISSVSIMYSIPMLLLITAFLLYYLRTNWVLRLSHGVFLLGFYTLFLFGLVFWII